jgi:eukaryotic-like serine/threonine-protein kinase
MLKVAGREKERWLDTESIDNFPCEDLRTIDQLWVKYSNGRFGFSVQKRIYQSLRGTREYDRSVWNKFGDQVGWRKNNSWLHYKDLTYSEKAPEAHLPSYRYVNDVMRDWGAAVPRYQMGTGSLLSRRDL